jgi:GMP synthase (glutamine-hydrolysing)
MTPPRVLVVDSEPKHARNERRGRGRSTASESFIATLNRLNPELQCDHVAPVDAEVSSKIDAERYEAVFFSGSPLHFYEDSDEVSRVLRFSALVFDTGLPCFGSCAGLQIATRVAGGRARAKREQSELGLARGIVPTDTGRKHWLLEGRSQSFDAPSLHGDEVAELPCGAILLAGSSQTRVQAAEMVVGKSKFWGVQYHPEISL